MESPDTKLEFAAAMLGTAPDMRGGLLMTVPAEGWCANDACVAIEDVELDRVGDEGRTG